MGHLTIICWRGLLLRYDIPATRKIIMIILTFLRISGNLRIPTMVHSASTRYGVVEQTCLLLTAKYNQFTFSPFKVDKKGFNDLEVLRPALSETSLMIYFPPTRSIADYRTDVACASYGTTVVISDFVEDKHQFMRHIGCSERPEFGCFSVKTALSCT